MAEQESLYLWSTTALTNETADPAVGWAENQLPSTVNNSARAMMAAVARFVKDTDGSLTTAGSANAYTLTINGRQTPLATGHRLSFKASFANTGAATLAVTNADAVALGTKAIRGPGDVALAVGQIISGGRYDVEYDTAANSAAGAWILLNPTPKREVLTAARTYYVRTDGSDSNAGLANTAGGAFLTIQKAIDTVMNSLDLGGFNVTISVAAGTYTGAITVTGRWTGAGTVTLQGDTTTPTNVFISTTAVACIVLTDAKLAIAGFKLKCTGLFFCINALYGCHVDIANCYFDASTGGMNIGFNSEAYTTGPMTFNGAFGIGVHNTNMSQFNTDADTWTLSGSNSYSAFFFGTSENSSSLWLAAFSGTATGVRAFIHQGSTVESSGGWTSPDQYFPGNAASNWNSGYFNDYCGTIYARTGVNFYGATSGSTSVIPAAVASGTISIPSATDTLVGKATTDTLTNKTIDGAGTGNAITHATKSALALRANRSASQTPSAGAWTKIQLNVEASDPNTWFDNATNYRLQPTVACVLILVGSTNVNVGVTSYGGVAIYKNGTEYDKYLIPTTAASDMQVAVPAIVAFNGSSDYVELFGFSSGASPTFAGGAEITKLDAYQLY